MIWNDLKSSPLGRTADTLALPWTIPVFGIEGVRGCDKGDVRW